MQIDENVAINESVSLSPHVIIAGAPLEIQPIHLEERTTVWPHANCMGRTILPAGTQLGPNSRALAGVDQETGDASLSSELVRAGIPAVSFVDSGLLSVPQ